MTDPALIAQHEYDELIFGGYICLNCSPKEHEDGYGDPDTTVMWPCPPLREAGMTDDEALDVIHAHRQEIQAKHLAELAEAVADWNDTHPVGTPVRYWTGVREGPGKQAVTRTPAEVLSGHTPVVWVSGEASCIALTHVEPVYADQPAA